MYPPQAEEAVDVYKKVIYLFRNLNIQTDSQTTCMKDEGPDVRAKFE